MKSKNTKPSTDKGFFIECEIYPFQIYVSIGENKKKILKVLQDKISSKDKELIKSCEFKVGKTIIFENGSGLIWIKDFPNTPFMKGVLSHEIFHYVTMLFYRLGFTLSQDSDEAYAYLIQYLTSKIYEKKVCDL